MQNIIVAFGAIIHWPLYIVGYLVGLLAYPLTLGFTNGFKIVITTAMAPYLNEINEKGLEKLNKLDREE